MFPTGRSPYLIALAKSKLLGLVSAARERQERQLRKRVDPSPRRYEGKPKFKYLLPLYDEIAERVTPLSKPYPQCAASRDIAAPDLQSGETGEAPRARRSSHIVDQPSMSIFGFATQSSFLQIAVWAL